MHHYFLYTVAANFYQGVIVFSYFSLCTDPPPLKENPEGGGGDGGAGVSVHRLQVFPTQSFSFVLRQSHFQSFFKCYST